MRIGIFGGTFNPVHIGHMIIAQEVQEKVSLDKVLFIPAFIPPHKAGKKIAEPNHRLAMLNLAIAGHEGFEVTDLEIRRGGSSYSIDTAESVSRQFPQGEIFFIIGRDTLLELPTWKSIHKLLQIVTFITVSRPDREKREISALSSHFDKNELSKLENGILDTPPIGISSTMVREKIRKGQSIQYLVPKAVEKYILEKKLYR